MIDLQAVAQFAASVVAGVVAVLGLGLGGQTSPVPATATTPLALSLVATFDTDLGTGSNEFSGVTVNEDLQRLLVVSDADVVFEFDLLDDGTVVTPPRRSIAIEIGGGDTEGIAWLAGNTYAVLAENFGPVIVFDLADDDTAITTASTFETVPTGLRESNGSGLEGVAAAATNGNDGSLRDFWVVFEKPPRLHLFGADGEVGSVALDAPEIGITDASDLWAAPDGSLFVLSDESRRLVHLLVDDDFTAIQVLGTRDLGAPPNGFEQPEGVTFSRDMTRMWIVSEAPGPERFSVGFYRAG